MNQNKSLQIMGVFVAIVVIAGVIIGVNLSSKSSERSLPNNDPAQKVKPAEVEDGQYYAYVEDVSANPEDTTITINFVSYYEGEAASTTAMLEGRESEIRNGVYIRESGAPSVSVPLMSPDLRSKIIERSYVPVYLITIENGAAVDIEEVTKQ